MGAKAGNKAGKQRGKRLKVWGGVDKARIGGAFLGVYETSKKSGQRRSDGV